MDALLLGVDVGTTGAKAVLIHERGGVVAEQTVEYPLSTPRPNWSEQDPEDWWRATTESIRAVLQAADVSGEAVRGVGLTGQMHGLTLLNESGGVLRPAILWNDQRTVAECEALTERVGAARVLSLTGNPILPGFTAPKIEWVRRHEADILKQTAHILLPKDYVRYRLTGSFCSDVADSAGTSLFDVGRRRWSEAMLAALDVPAAWLPQVSESPEVSSEVSAVGAEQTGLPAGTPVVAGAGDQAAQAIGAGIVSPGMLSVTLGTSGVVFAAMNEFSPEPAGRLHAFCHAAPGQWHLMGVMLSAAGSLRWLRDTLAGSGGPGADFEQLSGQAGAVAAGSEGLLFLPYLSGERTPHADADARGVFCGLSLRHEQGHLVRAVLEGVAFGLRDSLELMRGLGLTVGTVRVSGGGARSPVWRDILANVLGVPLRTLESEQGAAYGAALLAGVGANVFADVQDASGRVREAEVVAPGASQAVYERYYAEYRALYPALRERFAAMAKLAADS